MHDFSSLLSPKTRTRLVVLGLDGLPLSLAKSLCNAHPGRFPGLERLLRNACPVQAELPELSPTNWTSFYTAAGPEEHGVFGFTFLDPQSYAIGFTDARHVHAQSIFHILGERGLVSKVVNLPNTYPAAPLKGMLIAGFVAPELSRAVHPPVLANMLAEQGYKLEADTEKGKDDPEFLLAELHATLESRRTALDMLWPDLAWDLFVFVLTETDRLFHFLFPALEDAAHPHHAPCLHLMERWDALIAEVLERYDALPSPKRLIAMADHGFTTLRTEVDLNVWLQRQGYLELNAPPQGAAHELDASVIADASQAFALDPGRIYLHTKDVYARGCVAPADCAGLKTVLRRELLALRYSKTGELVMEAVHDGDELYPGARERFAPGVVPDLVCQARPGFDLKAKFNREQLFGLFGRYGAHTVDDAFFSDTQGAAPQRVRDIGRLVLEHFGLYPQTNNTLIL